MVKPQSTSEPQVFPRDLPDSPLSEMAEDVLSWLQEHPELRIHETSRIPALCRRVIKHSGHVSEPGDPQYVELQQSFKDIQELWYIVLVLGDRLLTDPFAKPLIRAAANDCQLPEDSGDNTVGRDAQFELFVGAIGYRVGFQVEHLGESQPDWVMATDLRKWTVETKRAKSVNAVRRLTKKAAHQIDTSTVGGIIAIDVSTIGGSEERRLKDCVPDQQLEAARLRMGEAIRNDELPKLKAAIGDAPVGMLVIHDYLIRPAGKKDNGDEVPWGLHGMWWAYHLESPSSAQYDRYTEFWDLFGISLPAL